MPKTGQPVLEVLRSNNPETRPPISSSLEAYRGKPPAIVPVHITDATVATAARRLFGAAGPEGVDLVRLQHWMLQFGVVSMGIRHIVGEFRDWMANSLPPWATYRLLILGRIIGLYNCPGVRRVGVGETWRWMLDKCVLEVTGADAKEA